MSRSDKDELGVKLYSWHNGDAAAGVPIKKRRFLLVRSSSPPPSYGPSLPADACDLPPSESSVSDAGGQILDSGSAAVRNPSLEYRAEPLGNTNVNLAPTCESSLGFNQDLMFTLGANASTELSSGGKPFVDNRSAFRYTVEKTEFRSVLKDSELLLEEGSGGSKLVLSDKSAFHRASGITELPLASKTPSGLSPGSQILAGSCVKQGKIDPCSLGLALADSRCKVQSKLSDTELKTGSATLHTNRSHWDLNTMMDTWEGSLRNVPADYGASRNDGLDLGDMHKKEVEALLSQMAHPESSGTCETSGKCRLDESESHLRPCSSAALSNKLDDNKTDLNLQLNAAFGSLSHFNIGVPCASTQLSSHKVVSNLSLSILPRTSTHNLNLVVADAVKPEPVDVGDAQGPKSVEVSNLKSICYTILRSEPCEGIIQNGVAPPCLNNVKFACNSAVKSEPLEVLPQGDLQTLEERTQYTDSCTMEASISSGMHQDTKENITRVSNLVSQALIADGNKIDHHIETPYMVDVGCITSERISNIPDPVAEPFVSHDIKLDFGHDLPVGAELHQVASQVTDKFTNVVSESVPVINSLNGQVISIGADMPQDADQTVGKTPELVSASRTAVSNELHAIKEADEVIIKALAVSLNSNKETVINGLQKVDANMSCSDDGCFKSSRFVSMDDSHMDSLEAAKTNEKGNIEIAESHEHVDKSERSHDASDLTDTVPKQHGYNDDYEDGEVRDLLLRRAMKGLCEDSEAKYVHANQAADSIVSVEALVMALPCLDGNGSELQNVDESKDVHCTVETDSLVGSKKNDAGLNTTMGVKNSVDIGTAVTGSVKKKSHKIIRKVPRDQLGKDKSYKFPSASASAMDDGLHDIGSKQVKAVGDSTLFRDHPVVSKTEVSVSRDVTKNVSSSKREQTRIIHLNSSSNASSSGRTKSISNRLSSSQIEGERLRDKSPRGDKPHLRSIRDERHVDGMHKSKKKRDTDQQLRKLGSDFSHVRGRRVDQRLDTRPSDWHPDHGYPSEHFSSSNSFRFPRAKNASEVAFAAGMDGSFASVGRTVRRVDDEPKNFCPLRSRRYSPGGREGPVQVDMLMVHRPMGSPSPGRCIEGLPQQLVPSHEEKFMRGLADGVADPSLFACSRPSYDPGENCLIRNERRSLSPIQRRGVPHLSQIYLMSPPRPRVCSPRPWSPSRRSPDGFNRQPEVTCGRSSPILTVERMRLPRQRACFPDDIVGRGHVPPHYIPRLHDEMRDIGPLRDQDSLRPGRHLQRNIGRFDLIGSQVNVEEEYFGHQFHGVEGDEGRANERRNSDERQGLVRSFRQQYNVGNDNDNNETFQYRVEDIPPRPIRFCAQVDEAFPDSGIPRDGCIRNRLGNVHGRLRGMDEQVDNYRPDGEQGWRGASSKDSRLKRRRF